MAGGNSPPETGCPVPDAVHGLTGVQGINPYDLQQTGDALEQHAAGSPEKSGLTGHSQREG